MAVLENLEPKKVYKYFEEICGIPHGSYNTKQISDYLVEFAKSKDLKYIQDEANNVIIYKEGTAGYENSDPVMLQGHMDMVCEKENDCDIDFEREGLRLQCDGKAITAKGTTLGGDDGIAVAYALAILDSEDIPHPPLEVVITVDEEVGMLGAAKIDASVLKSKVMLNIDSEEEGVLLVSCAGGMTSECVIPVEYQSNLKGKTGYKISVAGLLGGHSGVEIDKNRANANKVLGRVLYAISKEVSMCLACVDGGLKDNAIPRESHAYITFDEADFDKVHELISKIEDALKNEYMYTDSDIKLNIEKASVKKAMSPASTNKVITALYCYPNGIMRMSSDIEGLVQSSLNMGVLLTDEDNVIFRFSVRSSVETEKIDIGNQLRCLTEALGGNYSETGSYPAWEYKQDSRLRNIMKKIYEDMFNDVPDIQAIHAGLECGLFAGKLPGLDCISYGPRIDDIHTPAETLYVDSVKRMWDYTLEVLKQLK